MSKVFSVEAIGTVHAKRTVAEDDSWGGSSSRIVLADNFPPESLDGIEEFSHVEVLFCFDRVAEDKIVRDARSLVVGELDAIDGTPVLDLKPVMLEFPPRSPVSQPSWSKELMADYWAQD